MSRRLLAAALLVLAAAPARAAATSWTGGASGDWGQAANWSGGLVPGPTDDATIASAFVVTYATDAALSVNSLTLGSGGVLSLSTGLASAGAVTLQGGAALQFAAAVSFVAGTLDLQTGSSATFVGAAVPAGPVPALSLQAGLFALAGGSTFTVAGRGYAGGAGGGSPAAGAGPSGGGGVGSAGAGGGGGGHGGAGGDGAGAVNGSAAYDGLPPTDGGAGGGGAPGAVGGGGGGFLVVDASTVTLNGWISADGLDGDTFGFSGAGGGAGGAVLIRTQVLTGTGTITARGGKGGSAASQGGGGGGGGIVWLREFPAPAVLRSTLTVTTSGGLGGSAAAFGADGAAGLVFEDPRYWAASGASRLASNPSNWSAGIVPKGGETVVFGSSATSVSCTWDLGSVAVGSVTVGAAFSTSVVLSASMTVTGTFALAGGTVTSAAGLDLSVGGDLAQTGGRLDLAGSSLTLAGQGFSAAASFLDARAGALLIGGAGAATATVNGPFTTQGQIAVDPAATLSLSTAALRIGGDGPFTGGGGVRLTTGTSLTANGASTQTWTAWPGALGALTVANASSGGLVLSTASGAAFTLAGGLTVSTGARLSAPGALLEIGGDWASYGAASMATSTVAFKAASGTQTVSAGGSFDNLVVDDAGAALKLSTWVVVASSVGVVSGTLDLAASTLTVRGRWTESPGARVLGGTSVAVFDGILPQAVYQLGGNSFGAFLSSCAGGVSVSSTLATSAGFEWHRGNLNLSNAALTIGGDMLVKGGIVLTVAGSTVVFDGASTQTVTFTQFGDFVDANTGPGGVALAGAFVSVASFYVRPGSLLNAGGGTLTSAGPVWDTALSTYVASNPTHVVRWNPASAISVGAGSVVNARLTLFAGKTANLLGDLNIGGAGDVLDVQTGALLVNAPGGSTIAFRGSADLIPTGGAGWTYGGDAANSWLVFEGSGTARGASIPNIPLGTVRVTLNTSSDVFKINTLNLQGSFIVESGTARPNGGTTLTLGGDLRQTGGAVDYATPSTGTIRLVGPAAQTLSLVSGAHSLWHLTDASTAPVGAASDLTVRGDFVVASGTFSAGAGSVALQGLVLVSTGAAFDGQASTVTLDGASGGRTSQTLAPYGTATFNGLAVNVLNASLLGPATAAVFADGVAGGTLTVAAGTQLTAADVRLGPSGGSRLALRSSIPGVSWYLDATAVSSATAVTVSDSDASPGVPILANDGRSADAGNNRNWTFHPLLLVVLPGETYTPSVAPGKSGAPSPAIAGVPIPVAALAVTSRYEPASAATGTVTLSSDDPYALLSAPQPLANGAASFTFTPLTAEPAPRATRVTASAFFASGVSTAPAIPAGLARLQIVMFGETPLPGSPTGHFGFPFARVKGVPFSMTVRAVDSYWNLVSTVTDSFALQTSASSTTVPAPPALASGQAVPGGLVIYTTGYFTLTATDLTQPAVQSSTGSLFGVVPPSVSSPTGAFYVPTGAAVATLGGAIAGTAADTSSVERVRVDVLELETGFHFDASAGAFSSLSPIYATTTLASPLAPSTSWSNPVPDAALVDGRHYAAIALVDDPTGFTGTAGSTFTVDRSALSYGSRSGLGAAAAFPTSAPGCEVVTASVAFTVGSAGIGPGGAVAVRAPDGWTAPAGLSSSSGPAAGYWNVASTSTAAAPASSTATVNAAAFGAQTLGPGWLLLSVATNAPASFAPGQKITFTYAGLPPLSPAGRGAQTFAVWTTADGTGPLAPISSQPAVSLTAGTTSVLAFADAAPLSLAPLQDSATMQLKVVDLCGNDKLGASSATASLSLVVPVGGAFAADASAAFHALSGATITAVSLSTGVGLSTSFTVRTSTAGPALAYVRASASFTVGPTSAPVVALRPARLVGSPQAFTGVSVDTGTLSPGTTSAALSATAPDAYAARLVFTLADPALAWDAALSLDAVNFSSPVFRATGFGDASRPIVLGWDGVDRTVSPARYAPAGHYRARLRAGGGTAADASVEVVVSTTAGYAGRLGASAAGAIVRAIGPGAGEGAATQASATGYFLLYGLRAGQAYQLTAATATLAGGLPVTLSTALAAPPASRPVADLGTVALPAPALLRVSAILPLGAPFDAVGGFVGRAADGSAAFSGALRFSSGAAVSDDGGPLFGRAASTWSAVLAAPGAYTLELDVPDLRLSTAVAGVTLGASGLDMTVPLDRRANAYGTVILPSTAAAPVTASMQATRAGDAAPSAFAAAAVSTSAPFALFGLDPGTWTVLASAPGFVPSSATIVVAGAADVSGLSLALGAGGTIVGTATVAGNSLAAAQCFAGAAGAPGACPAGTFDLSIEALSATTLDRAAARARLTASASGTSAAYALTGLAPGLWTLRSSLPGFSLGPAGGLAVSVAAAATSTSALTLAPEDARLRLTVNLAPLPGGACRAASAWASLGLSFDAADGTSRAFGDATALSGAGSFETLNCSSATFFSPALPPGPVRAAALFAPTGAWGFGRALLADGTTAALTLDLTASSAPASGLVSVGGLIAVGTRTASGVPYTVAATSAAGILSGAANVRFCLLGSRDPVAAKSLRVELVPYDSADAAPPLRRAPGGAGSCAAPAASTGASTALGFAAALNPDGSFAFSPGVAPGLYRLRVPGDLDDDASDGDEAVAYDQLVTIGAGGAVLAPRLGRGARVSGTLSAPASLPPGRLFHVALTGPDGSEARSADVAASSVAAAAFGFDGVGDGRYALTATDLSSPRAFAAPPLAVTVAGADVPRQNLALGASATVRARLAASRLLPDGTRQAVLITSENAGLLGPSFAATASGDPATGGSFASRAAAGGGLVDALGRVVIDGLPAGTYDVTFSAPPDPDALGAGALALASARVSGVSLSAGQVADLGVVPLFAGSYVSGRVTDAATGAGIAGLRVAARPSDAAGAAPGAASSSLTAETDATGRYLLRGLDPSRRWYDVTAAPRGALASGAALPPYAAKRALGVDVSSGAVRDFALSPAGFAVRGRVAAAGGATLTSSSGPGDAAAPGAVVTLQDASLPPSEDPLSDLALRTEPDGSFTVPAVAAGSYRLTASALGLGAAARAVVVTSTSADLGTLTLGSGAGLSGAVRLPDGSSPSADEVRAIAAAAPDSTDFQYAALTPDPTGRFVVGYSFGGLTPGRTYRLVVAGPGGAAYVPPEGAALTLAGTSDARLLDLTLRPAAGPVSFRARRTGTRWSVTAQFPRPLRARYAADSDPAVLLAAAAATGALSGGALAADRLSVSADYDPGPGETTAVFVASAALAAADWASADPAARELTISATASLRLAGDALTRASALNALGAALTFDGDAGRLVLPRGAFTVDAASSVAVSFARADSAAAFAAGAPPAAAAGPFYDVSLPPGTPAGLTRPAELTLSYSTSVADPSRLHVYWYNPAAGAYVLQPDALGGPLVLDRAARTATLRVGHFSTYVLLDASAGAIGGSASGAGDLDAYNFPNPFDLSVKTVTTIHGGGSPSVRGTLIAVTVPPGLSGAATLRVFEITGRLVRTIDLGVLAGGRVYYQGWDGRNDAGLDVASGLYLGQVELGPKRKTFKMAVLK